MPAKAKTTQPRKKGKTAGKPTRKQLIARLSALWDQMGYVSAAPGHPITKEPRRAQVAAAAFGEIRAICEAWMNNDLGSPLTWEDASKWIDAALAAGISFERHHNAKENTVAFGLCYTTGHDIARAFLTAASYGPQTMVDALQARWPYAANVRHVQKRDLRGELVGFSQVLVETRTELTIARLQGRHDRRGIEYGNRP